MQQDGTEWAALLAAAQAGDSRAMARFLTQVTPLIRAVVRARGRSLPRDLHEDVVQEVLLAIHLKRDSWQPDTPLRPWLYAVTRYKVIDAFRRRGSRVHLPIHDFAEIMADSRTDDPTAARDLGCCWRASTRGPRASSAPWASRGTVPTTSLPALA